MAEPQETGGRDDSSAQDPLADGLRAVFAEGAKAESSTTENEAPEAPRHLGDFEIIGELGRGGLGVVYEARQVSLNRKVALKVISNALGLSSKAVLRFRREAEAGGPPPHQHRSDLRHR